MMGTVETPGADPDPLLRADRAPTPRTLVDVLRATADDHPDSPAIDNGREVLTYDELLASAGDVSTALRDEGVGRGDRVGVRIPSGTTDLYVAIVGILLTGAAYVPVDHDDPDERARLVFNEAGVAAVVTTDLVILSTEDAAVPAPEEDPDLTDDAWIIFTSGSTGTPKGVAVSHRSAAAFVDAEARMFLQDKPIRPGDRVMAGPVRGVRRQLRGDVARLAVRRLPGSGPAIAGQVRHGPRAVAPGQRHHHRVDGAHPRRPLAGGRPRRRAPAHPRRRGLPTRDRCPPRHRRPRGLEHLRPHRGHRRRVWGPAHRRAAGAHRAAPRRLGPRRRRPPGRARARRRAGRADHRRRRPGPLPRPGQGRESSTPRCPPWAGTAPTAAGTSCGSTARAWSSTAGPTTRSRSAAGGSSSARSTARCSRSRA